MSNESYNNAWIEEKISISYKIGELCLKRCFVDGIYSNIDIFSVNALLKEDIYENIYPPVNILRKKGSHIARLESCPIKNTQPNVFIHKKYICFVDSTYKHFFVETKLNFDNYLESKKKIYSTIKRKLKKIENSNNKKYFEVYSSPKEFDVFFDLANSISKNTFQHILLDKGIPDTEEFRQYVKEESSKGNVIGYILNIDNKAVAYSFCPIKGDVALYDYSGYNPEYKEYSPGTVLQFKIIEDLFKNERVNYYDLCTGDGWHKEMFATGGIYCGNIYFCYIFSKYFILISLKIILFYLVFFLKNIFSFFAIKESTKKVIRRYALKMRRRS